MTRTTKSGRPLKAAKDKQLKFKVPAGLFEVLTAWAAQNMVGSSEHEVARTILLERIPALRKDRYLEAG